MKRITRSWAMGVGVAGMLLAATAARADDDASSSAGGDQGSGSSDASSSSEAESRSPPLAYPDAVYMKDVVKKMDGSKHEITMATSGKTMKMSDDVKVMRDGKPAAMSDVKEGEPIRAAVKGKGDSAEIVEIWILRPGSTSSGAGSKGE